jgi:hypothetical protein
MTREARYWCPHCKAEIRRTLDHGERIECAACHRTFSVVIDRASAAVGLVELNVWRVSRPLFLPRGSIRAVVTLTTAACAWTLAIRDMDLPEYLIGLLLAAVGSYFAFRQQSEDAPDTIYDATVPPEQPLFLPRGAIRWLLVAGFLVSAGVLLYGGRLGEEKYLEFFAVLGGLLAGYLLAKVLHPLRGGLLHAFSNHAKGLAVLGVTGYLAYLLLTGRHHDAPVLALALATAASFYFGTR